LRQSTKDSTKETKIQREDYIQMDVVQDKFKFKIPARGFNLRSLLDFQKSLRSVKSVTYKKISKKEYDKLFYGKPL